MNTNIQKKNLQYYKSSGLYLYIAIVAIIFIASIIFSWINSNWEHISRCGGIITVFGVFLLSSDLIRLGPYHVNEPKPPTALPTGGKLTQFNMDGVHAKINEKRDSYAKHIGIYIVVIGTLLWSYGDFFMELLFPYGK